jgi:hypothetical protein
MGPLGPLGVCYINYQYIQQSTTGTTVISPPVSDMGIKDTDNLEQVSPNSGSPFSPFPFPTVSFPFTLCY